MYTIRSLVMVRNQLIKKRKKKKGTQILFFSIFIYILKYPLIFVSVAVYCCLAQHTSGRGVSAAAMKFRGLLFFSKNREAAEEKKKDSKRGRERRERERERERERARMGARGAKGGSRIGRHFKKVFNERTFVKRRYERRRRVDPRRARRTLYSLLVFSLDAATRRHVK